MVLNIVDDDMIKSILERYRSVAVLGLSKNPAKDIHHVAKYLQSAGYRIIPVNPFVDQVLGERSYKKLCDVPDAIEIVDIFRPSEEVPAIVGEAIKLKNKQGVPKIIWMQLGIVNQEAVDGAKEEGFTVVMDKCMRKEHIHLSRELTLPAEHETS